MKLSLEYPPWFTGIAVLPCPDTLDSCLNRGFGLSWVRYGDFSAIRPFKMQLLICYNAGRRVFYKFGGSF